MSHIQPPISCPDTVRGPSSTHRLGIRHSRRKNYFPIVRIDWRLFWMEVLIEAFYARAVGAEILRHNMTSLEILILIFSHLPRNVLSYENSEEILTRYSLSWYPLAQLTFTHQTQTSTSTQKLQHSTTTLNAITNIIPYLPLPPSPSHASLPAPEVTQHTQSNPHTPASVNTLTTQRLKTHPHPSSSILIRSPEFLFLESHLDRRG